MMNLSDYAAAALLSWVVGTDMPSAPASVYVALYDGDPGGDGSGGTDITDTISAGRVEVTWSAVAARGISNSAIVDFGNALADATADYIALWDDATAGNCLATGALSASVDITTGAPTTIPIGDLTIGA